jgi:hypothetical protein
LDEVLILPLLITCAIKLIPAQTMAECRKQAEGMWRDGKPKRFVYALPVLIIWLALIALIAKLV